MRTESISAGGSRDIGRVVPWLVVLALHVALPARADEPDACSKFRAVTERDIDIGDMESWSASKNPRDARKKLRRWILDSTELLHRAEGAPSVMKWIPALVREVPLTDSEKVRLARLDLLRFYQAAGKADNLEDLLRGTLWKTRRSQRALRKELWDQNPFTDEELARLTEQQREDLEALRKEVQESDATVAQLEARLTQLKEDLSSEELSDEERNNLTKEINSTQEKLEDERLTRERFFGQYLNKLSTACDRLGQ